MEMVRLVLEVVDVSKSGAPAHWPSACRRSHSFQNVDNGGTKKKTRLWFRAWRTRISICTCPELTRRHSASEARQNWIGDFLG